MQRMTAHGEGWKTATLADMGDGPGFRKVRKELGVEAFGVNAIVMPPGIETGFHWHDASALMAEPSADVAKISNTGVGALSRRFDQNGFSACHAVLKQTPPWKE